jgi:cytochrome c peroxidase
VSPIRLVLVPMIAVAALALLQAQQTTHPTFPFSKGRAIRVPWGLPALPIPPDNPPTAETIALGRRLFFDPILG